MSFEATDRQTRLRRFFDSVIHGKTEISSARQSILFIEAICAQDDTALLADRLLSNHKSLEALRRCVRQDLSIDFIEGPASQLLAKIADPSLAAIDSGTVLSQILKCLLQPSFFWSACITNLKNRLLNPDTIRHVAWLLAETLRLFSAHDVEPYLSLATDNQVIDVILGSESVEARSYGYQIKQRALLRSGGEYHRDDGLGPGGRHDNDHKNIQDIKLIPTRDEILARQPAFLREASDAFGCEDPEKRPFIYVDNMFRLLREDMVYDFREKLRKTDDIKTARPWSIVPSAVLAGIDLNDIDETKPWRREPWAICLRSNGPLPGLEKMTKNARRTHLENARGSGSKTMRHGAMVAICTGGQVIGFGYINRLVDRLSSDLAEVVLRLDDSSDAVLDRAISGIQFDILQIDTAVFAYEPFLRRLQRMQMPRLCNIMLGDGNDLDITQPNALMQRLVNKIGSGKGQDIQQLLKGKKSLHLDASQRAALVSGLSQCISLIQGPPGTGKSFIGALIARALHDNLPGPMIIICYTNHALDQFTEDLIDIGIPQDSIVRLGSKSSARTETLLLRHQKNSAKLSASDWHKVNDAEDQIRKLETDMKKLFQNMYAPVSTKEILDHLEFLDNGEYFEALHIPDSFDGTVRVGQKGKAVQPDYLLKRWRKGSSNAVAFARHDTIRSSQVWQLPREARHRLYQTWEQDLRQQHIEDFKVASRLYNHHQQATQDVFRSRDAETIARKKIVACTSTYAAMSEGILSRVQPETVLLEEAGELLEPHVLTSISNTTRRLILIGDHKQLRPKIANYSLSVEAGYGYDLNRSLFERLLLRGFPHVSLSKQHRMRPEISGIVRHLTYSNLEDGPSTSDRPTIRGLQGSVVFVDHREPEQALEKVKQQQPGSSKQNIYEAYLALRYVKYLAQQGYGSDDIVVLTPYLAQLRLLRETLSKENDPVLNDLDSHDLYQAGLLDLNGPKPKGRQVHISSIDNYQGEEKNIVIISLTRSNSGGDIGFMSQPERVNVLLSRARDGLIVIGNWSTFTSAKKGRDMWRSLRDYAKEHRFMYQGLPIQCQLHPDVKNTVVKPDDFLTLCPDGGCSQHCSETLACGQHKCPSRCHILVDHSKIICSEIVKDTCPQGHTQTWRCQAKPASGCTTCNKLSDKRRRMAQAKLNQIQRDEADKGFHDQKMEALDEEITLIRHEIATKRLKEEREKVLTTKERDLRQARSQLEKAKNKQTAPSTTSSGPTNIDNNDNIDNTKISGHAQHSYPQDSTSDVSGTADPSNGPDTKDISPAQREWQRQKQVNNQSNEAMDELMALVGLEDVKQYILNTKGRIEIQKRQDVDTAGERFHAAFLGNPGTGKTTVARLWAKLLCSLEVIQSEAFEETTGSKLATNGVLQAQKHIDALVNRSGGVMFVDEAYQLTNGTSAGGKSVLDFLLTEIENRRGVIVFVFAGYKQPMEAFFGYNPGIRSRIPHVFDFLDYSQTDLLKMLQDLFKKRFNGKAQVEGSLNGLSMRIVTKRLARQRGNEGFGNMRDLENVFSHICGRQARRIENERRDGKLPDDFSFIQTDLIGPEPSATVPKSPAWTELQDLIGLQSVKASIETLVSLLKTNYMRELQEKEPIQVTLNKVFLGSPGTGKTSVAKLYGRLLADIGVLSNGDVVAKTPADFIGSALGSSEQATNSILDSARGKVLIIDEAYMLDPSSGAESASTNPDPYRTAVIDTIVAKVHNVPGDDCCVLLLGYEAQMEAMFQRVNPGFGRRFPLEDAFRFEDFADEELRQILKLKLAKQDLSATSKGEETALELLARERKLINFGNAGAVDNLISRAKISRQKRMTSGCDGVFELESIDFDPDFARAVTADTRLTELFQDTIGLDYLVTQLREYQTIASNVKSKSLPVEDHVPFNFVFKGPPGTGKTSTARKIGQVYYDMGLLHRAEVVEISVSDLVGQYVGQTGPKTQKQLEKGLGKVLFVDEAYRLGEGHFATEAVNELVDLLTKPKFKGKLVVVLAGYENEMDNLIAVNPGLASRFPEPVMFVGLTAVQCKDLLATQLRQNGLWCPSFDHNDTAEARELLSIFNDLTQLKLWGNARDVQNISRKAMRHAFGRDSQSGEDSTIIPHGVIVENLKKELSTRRKTEGQSMKDSNDIPSFPSMSLSTPAPTSQIGPTTTATAMTHTADEGQTELEDAICEDEPSSGRDAGVSDATWIQLQADDAAAKERQRQDAAALQALQTEANDAENALHDAEQELEYCQKAVSSRDDESPDSSSSEDESAAEARRLRLQALEKARLRRQQMLEERERAEDKKKREKERQDKERKEQAVAQKKLRQMGLCPVGFRWIKQATGYRCAGGAHFVSHTELDGIN